VIVDRASDLVVLVLGLMIAAPLTTHARWLDRLLIASVIGLALLGVALLVARAFAKRRTAQATSRVQKAFHDLLESLATRPSAKGTARVLGLSVLAWTAWAAAAWAVAASLGFHLSPLEAMFVTSVMNLGVAIPSSPGFVGTYQWLAVASLTLLDVDREQALAFAILVQAVWFVPTTILGGIVVVRRALAGALVAGPAQPVRTNSAA